MQVTATLSIACLHELVRWFGCG